MNLKFLGRWSSNLVTGQRNISFLLDDKIAFDFGPHSLESLLERRIDPNRIDIVLISHMHFDHFAGVAELLWYRSIYGAKNELTIYGPKGTRASTEKILKLYQTPGPWYKEQISKHVDYVEGEDADFVKIFHSNHTVPTNGYRVKYAGKLIFYSGDTAFSNEVIRGARNVDWLIHEMTYTDEDRKSADLWRHSVSADTLRVFKESGAAHLIPVHLTNSSDQYVHKLVGELEGLVYPSDTVEL